MRFLSAVLAASLVCACGSSSSSLNNPTGSCTAPNDGNRAGLSSSSGAVWLPDCQSPTAREYWRVFAETDSIAYTLPRIDGDARVRQACLEPSVPVHDLLVRYSACGDVDPATINSMTAADALMITRYLHQHLTFTPAGQAGTDPPPLASDIYDICQRYPKVLSGPLAPFCQAHDSDLASLQMQGSLVFTDDQANALAQWLNELYGTHR